MESHNLAYIEDLLFGSIPQRGTKFTGGAQQNTADTVHARARLFTAQCAHCFYSFSEQLLLLRPSVCPSSILPVHNGNFSSIGAFWCLPPNREPELTQMVDQMSPYGPAVFLLAVQTQAEEAPS